VPEPARYPISDKQEQESLGVLLRLLDSAVVKADIKIRDKVPNVDGTLKSLMKINFQSLNLMFN
jgi:hypothetical protein